MVVLVKPINDEGCLPEECWLPRHAVVVEMTGVVVNDILWCDGEALHHYIKRHGDTLCRIHETYGIYDAVTTTARHDHDTATEFLIHRKALFASFPRGLWRLV